MLLSDKIKKIKNDEELLFARTSILRCIKSKAEIVSFKSQYEEILTVMLGDNAARVLIEDNTWVNQKEFLNLINRLKLYNNIIQQQYYLENNYKEIDNGYF